MSSNNRPANSRHAQQELANPKTPARIAVLDSGVGGLSIAVPYAHWASSASSQPLTIDYLADTGYYPYGTKPKPALIRRVIALVTAYLRRHPDCQQLIIACNTASTLCLDALRQTFALPIIGVVPALKPACKASTKPTIGLLATEATVERRYIDDLMGQFGGDKSLIKVGSQSLVALAEQLLHQPSGTTAAESAQLLRAISADLEPFREPLRMGTLDTIVLGCTHFPWVQDTVRSLLPDATPLTLLDSTAAIIRRSVELLRGSQHSGKQPEPGQPEPKQPEPEQPELVLPELSLPQQETLPGCYYFTTAHTDNPHTSDAAEIFLNRCPLPLS